MVVAFGSKKIRFFFNIISLLIIIRQKKSTEALLFSIKVAEVCFCEANWKSMLLNTVAQNESLFFKSKME